MTRHTHHMLLLALAAAGVSLSPMAASAQFVGGFIPPTPLQPIGGLSAPLPRFNYSEQYYVRVGPITYRTGYQGPVGYYMAKNFDFPGYRYVRPAYAPPGDWLTAPSGGYMTGGAWNPTQAAAQQAYGKAQKTATTAANLGSARDQISGSWGYENLGNNAMGPVKPIPPTPVQTDEALATGGALNKALEAIRTAEAKGSKAPAPFIRPEVLAEIRFAGSPTADTVNLIRQIGQLEFPVAFDTIPALRELKPVLDRDFAAAVTPILSGKPADPLKVMALVTTIKQAQDRLTPVLKDLGFEEATDARRFLNRMDSVPTVLRDRDVTGLVNPRWATEGVSATDLVRYMTKYKLRFGPVEKGHEEVYMALYRDLFAYYAMLEQNIPVKK